MWRERMRAHADGAEYVHVIVNEGRDAGASLPHTHAQLYALRFVPAAIARERERFTAWHDRTQGRNLLEDLVQEEVRLRERVVAVDGEAVALSPYAARVPFHLQIVPRRPRARFEDDGPLGAAMLLDVLRRL
jgi:UDPglucose--hexose-1-phosphate uridylyltransferase